MTRSAVLLSGGLDSAVLLAVEREQGFEVWPFHIRAGLAWEDSEAETIRELLLSDSFAANTKPLTVLAVDMRDVYPVTHWAFEGAAPGYDSPDEAVYLPGRNIVLTTKTAVFASEHGIGRIALGPLAGNPFPDATPAFFATISRALSIGLAHDLEVVAPLSGMKKADVVRRGRAFNVPMELTMSCLRPDGRMHCGRCNKCRERRDAFIEAGVVDLTRYALL